MVDGRSGCPTNLAWVQRSFADLRFAPYRRIIYIMLSQFRNATLRKPTSSADLFTSLFPYGPLQTD